MTTCTTCELIRLQVEVAVHEVPGAPVILSIVDGLKDVSQTVLVRTIWLEVESIWIIPEDAFQDAVAVGIIPIQQILAACYNGVSIPKRTGLTAVDHRERCVKTPLAVASEAVDYLLQAILTTLIPSNCHE